ncbi:FAD-dependent oxidoreductase [Verrucomicrobiaceae bacterium 227]
MIEVIGFGLAGACVALQLQRTGHAVRVVDDGLPGSTRVAAGLVNPVAGRNFEISRDLAKSLAVAIPFYRDLGEELFHPMVITRLWFDAKDRAKFERKRGQFEDWIAKVDDEGVTWKGGGWLDCPGFLEAARREFLKAGGEFINTPSGNEAIWCTGAAGLIRKDFPNVDHRSAKGEILTVRIPGWNEGRILIRGGWIIPIGNDLYRTGATYEWENLESGPSDVGREKVEGILKNFTSLDYEVVDHVAGIRPIIDRSNPSIRYEKGRGWFVNGLGSKGVISAPGLALDLVRELTMGRFDG